MFRAAALLPVIHPSRFQGTSCSRLGGLVSVLGCHGHDVLMATHFLKYSSQSVQVTVREVLCLPQVQNPTGRTGLSGKVVKLPEREDKNKSFSWFLLLFHLAPRLNYTFQLLYGNYQTVRVLPFLCYLT